MLFQVTLVALSGMTDINKLITGNPELCRQKVGRIVLMSGVEVEGNEVKLSEEGSRQTHWDQRRMR